MNEKKLRRTIAEAEEFIERANELLADVNKKRSFFMVTGTRKSGAVRRQSLELTRSLAELRRPS